MRILTCVLLAALLTVAACEADGGTGGAGGAGTTASATRPATEASAASPRRESDAPVERASDGSASAEAETHQPCSPVHGQPRDERLGVSPGHTLVSEDVAAVDRDLDGIAAAGVCWVRIDIDWSRIQPEREIYDWDATDRAVHGARARGLEVLAMIGYTPAWARPGGTGDKHPPSNVEDFAAFAAEAARRYGPDGVHAWEIWNEPNIESFWQPRPDPLAYADLLAAAAGTIRANIDDATIISAGLSPASDDHGNISPVRYLEELYAAESAEYFDAVGMHPYSYPLDPADPVPMNHFATVTPQLREVMVRAGDADSELWATEFGAPTGTSDQAVSEEEQAQQLAAGLDLWDSWEWTGPMMIYAWRDRGTDRGDREQNFGLVDHAFRPKPALDVLLGETGGSAAT